MPSLSSVPNEQAEQQVLGSFEGLIVNRNRVAAGSIPEFACLDENGDPLTLEEGDVGIIQVEVLFTSVEHGSSYKGGMQIGPRDRVHHGKVIDGSQQIVGVQKQRVE